MSRNFVLYLFPPNLLYTIVIPVNNILHFIKGCRGIRGRNCTGTCAVVSSTCGNINIIASGVRVRGNNRPGGYALANNLRSGTTRKLSRSG